MAAPSYGTDLTLVNAADAITNWVIPTGMNSTGGATADTEYPWIQNSMAVTQTATKTGLAGLAYNNTSGITVPTDGAILIWQIYTASGLATFANSGLRVLVGSAQGAYYWWPAGGSDFGRMPYGGWQNHAVNPSVTANRTAYGSPSGSNIYMGAICSIAAGIGKGNIHGVDVIRYGRCEARFSAGESGNYCTFLGYARGLNDLVANRYGLIQEIPGGVLWKGLITLGYGALVNFVDSNIQVLVDNTPNVTAAFNKIEIRNASSVVTLTNVTFKALGTVAKGQLEVIDNCDVNIDGCVFDSWDSFIFLANSAVEDTTWRGCGLVTNGGAAFTRCLFDSATGAIAVTTTELDKLNACTFISDGTGHAVELTSIGDGTMVWNCLTSGYAASDGSTGNEVIYINCTSSSDLAITVTGGASTPTIRKAASYTGTVTFPTSVTLRMEVKDEAGDPVNGAYAYIDNNDQSPYILNTTTGSDGIAETSYSGSTVNGSRWRVRKYGYKSFRQLVDIGTSNVTILVTLVADPQQV